MTEPPWFIGLMSGTSLDGVDAVLARFPGDAGTPVAVAGHAHVAYPDALRADLLALNEPGADELHRAAGAAVVVARHYAEASAAVLAGSGIDASQVRAIGAHGQTVRHRPDDALPYTLQLLDASVLAEATGIDVVSDFRSRDIAAGGQGAPLVPAFHAALFAREGLIQAVLNVGGIANLTLLEGAGPAGRIGGFDCGPGNMLLDLWCRRHLGQAFDRDGAWAAGGRVNADLLADFEREPFFHRAPPKSTGRDLFGDSWLASRLARHPQVAPRDVQATLAMLTGRAAASALRLQLPQAQRLLVCGGGALNGDLMRRLQAELPQVRIETTDVHGLPAQQVEAAAFAWLAMRHLQRRPGNVPGVTGARGPRVLGRMTPAG